MLDTENPSRRRFIHPAAAFVAVIALFTAAGYALAARPSEPTERVIEVTARSYAFEPSVIRVHRGDRVRLRFASLDVVHGFYLEGYDLDVQIEPMEPEVLLRRGSAGEPERVRELVFTADRSGKFRYRCSVTCGTMHPFMVGELVVAPNRLAPTSMGAAIGLLVGGFVAAWPRSGVSVRGDER